MLAPFGFWVEAPGLRAGALEDSGGRATEFVSQAADGGSDLWVYAGPGADARAVLPEVADGAVKVRFERAEPVAARVTDGALRFRTPVPAEDEPTRPPDRLAGTAPADWPQGPPAIGVLDFGDAFPGALTRVSPADWLRALRSSARLRAAGASVRAIGTGPELLAALDAGPESWLAIVNPYGENYPVPAGSTWREVLGAVADYVRRGGCWWETGGYSFYYGVDPAAPAAEAVRTGPSGCGILGIQVGGGQDVPQPSALVLSEAGRRWLGTVAEQMDGALSAVNRPLARTPDGLPHVALVEARDGAGDYIGGYRLNGWGWLWRVGGFRPDPAVVTAAVTAVLERLYTEPPEPVEVFGRRRVWHAQVMPAS
jgi:hypothetical protein